MNFLFPGSVKHLPNDEQLKLLCSLTIKKDFPGFLHPSSLKVTQPASYETDQIMFGDKPIGFTDDVKVRYTIYRTTTEEDLICALKKSPFIYSAFDEIKTYILSGINDVVGFITNNLETWWLETHVSLGELYTAVKNSIPIIQQFVSLGRNLTCTLCFGSFNVDWVDEIKYLNLKGKREIPKTRYLLVRLRDRYLLTDNIYVNLYAGDNIVSVCPHCSGTGISNILSPKDNNEGIESLSFSFEHPGLLIYDARNEIIEMPYDSYYDWDLKMG